MQTKKTSLLAYIYCVILLVLSGANIGLNTMLVCGITDQHSPAIFSLIGSVLSAVVFSVCAFHTAKDSKS